MKIVSDWRKIIKHAWSVRFIILAGILTGLETVLPDLPALLNLTSRQYSALSFAVVSTAFVARFIAQRKVSGNGE